MFIMKGKYNFAHIMIDYIDDSTKEQIQGFLNHPAFANTHIAIMPDCHAGKGAVVGFTMKMNDYIIPNIVGVDIGCGMLSRKFAIENIDLPKFDLFIKEHIPSGFSINNNIAESTGLYFKDKVQEVCKTIGVEDYKKALRAIGSLGGGNHFIEIGKDSKNNYWVTIHSGSRNFGLKVANYYQSIAKANLKKYFIGNEYKDLEFLLTNEKDGQDYIRDLKIVQKFASLNRLEMMNRITEYLGCGSLQEIESVHNFIGDDNIIRKGATPARQDEMVIIPFNMRDGLAICKGKGSSMYNYSAPHGAGRILSRTQAKKELLVVTFREQMEGIYTSTATIDTIDEAPNAYKDKQTIIDNIKDTVDIIDFVKPVYNFKAGAE
jgi:tRNA-splicing ligase RtcB (3'-phosphate/5'-hydroxy nucleic acid ligase)